MGYERRGKSFSFMGVVPIGTTVEVIPDEEETPAVLAWPPKGRAIEGGTVGLLSIEFARGLRSRRCRVVSR